MGLGKAGKRVESVQTGEPGTVTKIVNACYWVAMDDGRNMSGHKQYWKATKKPAWVSNSAPTRTEVN